MGQGRSAILEIAVGKYYIIEDFGLLFRISKTGWKKFLTLRARDEETDLRRCGAKVIGTVEANITDLCDPGDYQDKLDALTD
jgi:hypothetical protein